MDHLDATPLAGTDEARNPFFSPDGQWIGFFADGKLQKVSVSGGAPVKLCDAPSGRGGSWGDDGTIAFQPSNTGSGANFGLNIMKVSAAGGDVQPLTVRQEGEANERWPQILPGGRAVLYTAPPAAGNYVDAAVSAQLLPGHERRVLVKGGYYARYVASGHLLYMHGSTMFAAPFDLDRLAIVGSGVPVLEHVTVNTTLGGAQYAVSDTGTLVYLEGQDIAAELPISWLSKDGSTPLRAEASGWSNIAMAPDGKHLAMDIITQQSDIWTYDIQRGSLHRLTFDVGGHVQPVWTPDGKRVLFRGSGVASSVYNLFWVPADGSSPPQQLTTSKVAVYPGSFDPTGRYLAYADVDPGYTLKILPIEGDERSGYRPGQPYIFMRGSSVLIEPMFSPDGRWIAYVSNETSRSEVFVQPFPGPGGRWQVTTEGGMHPTWSRTRNELFFTTPGNRINFTRYSTDGGSFNFERPAQWSGAELAYRERGVAGISGRAFDIDPTGDRFAAGLAPAASTARMDKVVVITNFFDELRRLAPTKK
jgi:serine/threonine-protein kinase